MENKTTEQIESGYTIRKRVIKSIGIPTTIVLAALSLRGCGDLCTTDIRGPYTDKPEVMELEDTKQLLETVKIARTSILPYDTPKNDKNFYNGALPRAKNYASVSGIDAEKKEERTEVISYMENLVSELDAREKALESKIASLRENPVVKENEKIRLKTFRDQARDFGLYGALALIAGVSTYKLLERNQDRRWDELWENENSKAQQPTK